MPGSLYTRPSFDALPGWSFDAIPFPVESYDVIGGVRDHVHEFPHAPGGFPEKLGRRLYEVHAVCPFHSSFPKYPGLWPNSMSELFYLFETQKTAPLVIPTRGTIQAYCLNWKESMRARVRSGESLELVWREDQSDAVLVTPTSSAPTEVGVNADLFKAALAKMNAEQLAALDKDPKLSLFDAIQATANKVLAIRDTADMYGNLVAARVEELANLCQQADHMISLQDPALFNIASALHDLWLSAVKLAEDLQVRQGQLQTWVVPQKMSIQTAAVRLFHDAARSGDLLSLNPSLPDPYNIAAGTTLQYYPDS